MGPMVADALDELIDDCVEHILSLRYGVPGGDLDGDTWVTAAITTTVKAGARISINYIKAILDRWKTEGYMSERKTVYKDHGSAKKTNLEKSNEALDAFLAAHE